MIFTVFINNSTAFNKKQRLKRKKQKTKFFTKIFFSTVFEEFFSKLFLISIQSIYFFKLLKIVFILANFLNYEQPKFFILQFLIVKAN